jgi:two-component system, NarL family, nitrate/nitrite response regulator NarL
MLNIAISDKHPLFAHGLKHLLETETRFNVVGIGRNELELVDIISRHNVNLAIVNLQMPVLVGLAACKNLRLSYPGLKIIVLSTIEATNMAGEFQNIGVNGYISKSCEGTDLIKTINTVWEGKTAFPEYFSTATIKSSVPLLPVYNAGELTSREREIVSLVGSGFTTPAIAANLFISINTVKGHRKNILKKLNLKNIQQLVAYAIAIGLC